MNVKHPNSSKQLDTESKFVDLKDFKRDSKPMVFDEAALLDLLKEHELDDEAQTDTEMQSDYENDDEDFSVYDRLRAQQI